MLQSDTMLPHGCGSPGGRSMTQPADVGRALTHEQLPRLHHITNEVAKICRGQLRTYLDALAPLFRPRRVLGNHMDGAGKDLPTPLESVPAQIQFYEWEYMYDIRSERERKTITVVSPLTWVLAYSSTYTLSMMRQVVAGKQEQDAEGVRSFVLRACLMQLLFSKITELRPLFEGLRYRVEIRKSPQLGELPLVTLSAPVTTIRPTDDLLMTATGLSGRTGFEEVIDEDQAAHIPDPLQA